MQAHGSPCCFTGVMSRAANKQLGTGKQTFFQARRKIPPSFGGDVKRPAISDT
jgi:hypothetical protein